MFKRNKRPRTLRRELERELRKATKDRQRLVTLLPGGSVDQPLEVQSSAQIEGRVRSIGCARCDGELDVQHERVVTLDDRRVRELICRCRRCHEPRSLYFELVAPRVN